MDAQLARKAQRAGAAGFGVQRVAIPDVEVDAIERRDPGERAGEHHAAAHVQQLEAVGERAEAELGGEVDGTERDRDDAV